MDFLMERWWGNNEQFYRTVDAARIMTLTIFIDVQDWNTRWKTGDWRMFTYKGLSYGRIRWRNRSLISILYQHQLYCLGLLQMLIQFIVPPCYCLAAAAQTYTPGSNVSLVALIFISVYRIQLMFTGLGSSLERSQSLLHNSFSCVCWNNWGQFSCLGLGKNFYTREPSAYAHSSVKTNKQKKCKKTNKHPEHEFSHSKFAHWF